MSRLCSGGTASYNLVKRLIPALLKLQFCHTISNKRLLQTLIPLMRLYADMQAELICVLIIPISHLTVLFYPLISMTLMCFPSLRRYFNRYKTTTTSSSFSLLICVALFASTAIQVNLFLNKGCQNYALYLTYAIASFLDYDYHFHISAANTSLSVACVAFAFYVAASCQQFTVSEGLTNSLGLLLFSSCLPADSVHPYQCYLRADLQV